MGFAREKLNPGEELILEFKPHWKSLVPAGLRTLLIGAILGATVWLLPDEWRQKLWPILFAAAVVAWAIVVLPSILRWMLTEIVLTDERLVTRRGVIKRVTYDIPVDQINSVTVRQGLLDRLIRAGDLVVESASDTGDQVLLAVPRPDVVRNTISRTKELKTDRPSREYGDRLIELEALRQQGLITEAEYEHKRAELLRDL